MLEDNGDKPPQIKPISSPIPVPVFNVVIFVSQDDRGVLARVANLPDLEFRGSSEPTALKQAITKVKQILAEWHAAGEEIPWIDPIPEPDDGEQQRWVPVHL